MTLDPTKNFAKSVIATTGGINASATTLDVTTGDGSKFPDPATDGAFNLVLWDKATYPDPSDDPNVEIVRCTARSTDTLTITRGQEGTSGVSHEEGAGVMLAITKKMIDDINNSFGGGIPTWNNTDTYSNEQAVTKNGKLYVNVSGGDLTGEDPAKKMFPGVDMTSFTNGQWGYSNDSSTAKPGTMSFNENGTKIYYCSGGNIKSVNLNTAWDGSSYDTASVATVMDVADNINHFRFSADGSALYASNSIKFMKYPLSTPFDISTYGSLHSSASTGQIASFALSADETDIIFHRDSSGYLYHYKMTTAGDASTLTFVSSLSIGGTIVGVHSDSCGKYIYYSKQNDATLYSLKLSTAWDLSTQTSGDSHNFSGFYLGDFTLGGGHSVFQDYQSNSGGYYTYDNTALSGCKNWNLIK